MAGIGFALRELSRSGSISALLASAGHAIVIAAGPWLFTILSLAAISILSERITGLAQLASFRVTIIYAFALSLVLTAPITIVATRLLADALWSKRLDAVRGLFIATSLLCLVSVGLGVTLLAVFLPLPLLTALALGSASLIVALIWVALTFCGAVRDYNGVTLSFLAGLIIAMLAAVAAAVQGLGPDGMVLGFVGGLAITFLGMTGRILSTFPQPLLRPFDGLPQLRAGFRSYWTLALGAFFGTAGVWVDKVVFWLSETGERVDSGLLHAPLYDSAMFIASLVIIPSLAAFVVRLETEFFDRYQQYYATIQGHGTYQQIEAARGRLARYTLDNLTLITVAQVGICAVLVLIAPAIIEALAMQFRQIAILRYGALGAVFQFIFIASTSILLFFDRRRRYLLLQVLFFALSAGLSIATVQMGEDFYGVGYFLACLVSAFLAYRMADGTFDRLNYLTFIGNNPSIRDAASHKSRGPMREALSSAWRLLRQPSA